MTANTVPAMLDAVLDPLHALTEQVEAALDLARRNKLPAPFIQTIKASVASLDGIADTLTDIATALDPSLCQSKN